MRVLVLPLLLVAIGVNAQGYLSQPLPSFKRSVDKTACDALMTPRAAQNWVSSSISDLINSVVATCGHTFPKGKPVDVRAMRSMKWQNDDQRVGFSHDGPCEAWIDDIQAFLHGNCREVYPEYPAEIPVDFSVCTGTCMFTFYWMPVVDAATQVYKQCAPIENKQT